MAQITVLYGCGHTIVRQSGRYDPLYTCNQEKKLLGTPCQDCYEAYNVEAFKRIDSPWTKHQDYRDVLIQEFVLVIAEERSALLDN